MVFSRNISLKLSHWEGILSLGLNQEPYNIMIISYLFSNIKNTKLNNSKY